MHEAIKFPILWFPVSGWHCYLSLVGISSQNVLEMETLWLRDHTQAPVLGGGKGLRAVLHTSWRPREALPFCPPQSPYRPREKIFHRLVAGVPLVTGAGWKLGLSMTLQRWQGIELFVRKGVLGVESLEKASGLPYYFRSLVTGLPGVAEWSQCLT